MFRVFCVFVVSVSVCVWEVCVRVCLCLYLCVSVYVVRLFMVCVSVGFYMFFTLREQKAPVSEPSVEVSRVGCRSTSTAVPVR